jgi:predicted dehydrogenase
MTDVLVVGAGPMAAQYLPVLTALGATFEIVGRSEEGCRSFLERTGIRAHPHGIERYLEGRQPPERVIVAVDVSSLASATEALLDAGAHNLLVEKPGAPSIAALDRLESVASRVAARVLVGYNRRYLATSRRARQLIEDDGGVTSFRFDFTENAARVAESGHPAEVKQRWFLANSSHVVDLAFHLGGWPTEMEARSEGDLSWHPAGSRFAGSGVTGSGALFSYAADWTAPGGWEIELRTGSRRLLLSPLESLHTIDPRTRQPIGIPVDDELDRRFKPGLYGQTRDFLHEGPTLLPTLSHQAAAARTVFAHMVEGL